MDEFNAAGAYAGVIEWLVQGTFGPTDPAYVRYKEKGIH